MERDSDDGYEIRKVTTVTPSYHIARIPRGDDFEPIVISETDTLIQISNAEGTEGHISLSTRIEDNGSFTKTLWSKKINGHLVNYWDDFLEVTTYGCCGAEDAREIFRYPDGGSILLLTSYLNKIRIPNTRLQRYAGLLVETAAAYYADINDSLLCAVLTYSDPASLYKQRVVIDYKNRKAFDSLGDNAIEEMALMPSIKKDKDNYNRPGDLDLWSRDGNSNPEGFTDFTIELHVLGHEDLVISIPVENDKIRIDRVHSDFFDISLR
jgi:hypothetical protein